MLTRVGTVFHPHGQISLESQETFARPQEAAPLEPATHSMGCAWSWATVLDPHDPRGGGHLAS